MSQQFTVTQVLSAEEVADLPAFKDRYAAKADIPPPVEIPPLVVVDDDPTLAADSPTSPPSQRAVKAYVAAQIAAIPSAPPAQTVTSFQQNASKGVPGSAIVGQTTIGVAANRSVHCMWSTAVPIGISAVYVNVTIAGLTSSRLAIYRKNGSGVQESCQLVADLGTINVSTVGLKTITLPTPLELEPGVYVTCLVNSAESVTYGAVLTSGVLSQGNGIEVSNNLRPYTYSLDTTDQSAEIAAGAAATKTFVWNAGPSASGGLAQVAYFAFFV